MENRARKGSRVGNRGQGVGQGSGCQGGGGMPGTMLRFTGHLCQ